MIPRRSRLDLNTPAELVIFNAIQEVEKVGADPRLTEIVILLGKAKELLSDFIDNKNKYVLQLNDSNLFIAEDLLYTSDVTKAKVFDSKEAEKVNISLQLKSISTFIYSRNSFT